MLGAGVAIHLRDRSAGGRLLSDLAFALRDAMADTGAALIINARPDIARAVGAAGVQLGSGDLAVPDARRVFAGGWIGCSVHNLTEARAATDDHADFLIAGMIFQSATHPARQARGLDFVSEAGLFGSPVIAIGGVTLDRVAGLRDAGAHGVAVISAIWDAPDPAIAAGQMLQAWDAT